MQKLTVCVFVEYDPRKTTPDEIVGLVTGATTRGPLHDSGDAAALVVELVAAPEWAQDDEDLGEVAKPVQTGECYCCSNTAELWCVNTVLGTKLCCKDCCWDSYDVEPGYTHDGLILAHPETLKDSHVHPQSHDVSAAQPSLPADGP